MSTEPSCCCTMDMSTDPPTVKDREAGCRVRDAAHLAHELAAAEREVARLTRTLNAVADTTAAAQQVVEAHLRTRADARLVNAVVAAARAAAADILQVHPQIREANQAWFHPSTLQLVKAVDALDAEPGERWRAPAVSERSMWDDRAVELIREARVYLLRAREVVPAHLLSPWLIGLDRWIRSADAFISGQDPVAPTHVVRPDDRPPTLTCRYTGPTSPDDPECGRPATTHLRTPDFSAGALACDEHTAVGIAAGLTVSHPAQGPCATREPFWVGGPPSHCVQVGAASAVRLDDPSFVPKTVRALMPDEREAGEP